MCGIAGIRSASMHEARIAVGAMCRQMVPRGPDDSGTAFFEDRNTTLGLGSRRLSIIDLSPAGHQPMIDEARGTTIVFNGMIYNFERLRRALEAEGEQFRGHCDTEVVLRAYGRWGSDCVTRLRGMFAFAIWDERNRELFLARDRLGIKPLYYWQGGGRFLFASQVKALLRTGLIPLRLSREGIETFLDFGAVSDPLTAIEGVRALPAAHVAVFRDDQLKISRYWSFPTDPDSRLGKEEATRELRGLLDDTIRRHLISDAPLGVFLSGGLDSSLVAMLAARHTARVRTVSLVFEEAAFSEEPFIEAVSRRIESEHVRVTMRAADLSAWAGDAFKAMDQPSADGINTYVVSRIAHETGLKVALSGLGGDELFDGYGHVRRLAVLERVRRLPLPATRVIARAISAGTRGSRGSKASAWLAGALNGGSSYELLRRLFLPDDVDRLFLGGASRNGLPRPRPIDLQRELHGQASILDLENYTRNVLLRDTDAMSMSQSLEVRVPYLGDELVEWALRLPARTKGRQKSMLIDAVRDLLPQEVANRAKHGFLLPFPRWMRNELRNDIDSVLSDPPASVRGLIDAGEMQAVWREYLSGERHWSHPWSLYALCRWASEAEAEAAV